MIHHLCSPQCIAPLREKYGKDNVVLSDIKKPTASVLQEGPYVYGDVRDAKHVHSVVVDHAVDWVVNYSALLSAAAEKNFLQALEVLASDQTVCQSVGMGLLVM